MKLNINDPYLFANVGLGKPFYHKRRQAHGIKMSNSWRNPNSVLFFKDGSMDWEIAPSDEPVIPMTEVVVTFEQ